MREALYYRNDGEYVICELCPHACRLREEQIGLCKGRQALAGKLYAINYGECVSIAIDPIEKKPLYHFNPGTTILSLGPNSCNLSCSFCQNWQISQQQCSTRHVSIQELYSKVRELKPVQVAFTYSEPLMWYEYISDFSDSYPDVMIVLVTNGFLSEAPWKAILPRVSAMNIDLKSVKPDFYKKVCNGDIDVVKRNIKLAYISGIHLELTYLLIPGLNSEDEEIRDLAGFVASLDASIPLHISAYHPAYKECIRATTPDEVLHACDLASQYLSNVYAGNVCVPKYSRR